MNFIIDLIKGVFIGVANIIPGVSGGTMAVAFGVYDKMLSSISGLLKNFKKNFVTLFPIIVGMALGIICFTFIIPVCLSNQPFVTSMTFTGLILGGIPSLLKSLKTAMTEHNVKSITLVNIMFFLIFVGISIVIPFLNGDSESGILLTANIFTIIKVFIMGIIASAAMVIPGVSGSLILMVLGYYFGIISSIKNFLTALKGFNIAQMLNEVAILAPFAIGCIVGIFVISKLIAWLLRNYPVNTFFGILGLVITAPVSIFYKVNAEYTMKNTSIIQIVFGIIFLFLCILLTKFIGNLDTKEK